MSEDWEQRLEQITDAEARLRAVCVVIEAYAVGHRLVPIEVECEMRAIVKELRGLREALVPA